MSQPLLRLAEQWRIPLLLALLFVAMQLLLFLDTTRSLVEIWARSGTYNHGFIIAPIALWLIWEKRHSLARINPRPASGVLLLYVGGGLAWLAAEILGVQVVEQLALVSMLIIGLWVLLGHQVTKTIVFPLLFLYLAVPMGEGLVAPMMEFTATFTVKLLQLTGIPVYREGLFFSLPSGNWSVVEACSGVRYLIASVTLGLLYAYLSYQKLSKRILFVIASFLVPVLANGLRAYMIVMIGHLSGMELAVGVDHLIYGWVFFGLVMFILFWIGSYWRDTPVEKPSSNSVSPASDSIQARHWTISGIGLIAVALLIQGAQSAVYAPGNEQLSAEFELPAVIGEWQQMEDVAFDWRPRIMGTEHTQRVGYQKAGRQVMVFVALYPSQHQGSEAASAANTVIDTELDGLRITHQGQRPVWIDGSQTAVNAYQILISGSEQRLAVWQWYLTGASRSANPYLAKLHQLRNMIHPGRRDGAYLAIATLRSWDEADSNDILQQFLDEAVQEVERATTLAVWQQ